MAFESVGGPVAVADLQCEIQQRGNGGYRADQFVQTSQFVDGHAMDSAVKFSGGSPESGASSIEVPANPGQPQDPSDPGGQLR